MKNKEMEYYRAGMERLYRLYKEEGPEAMEKEIRFRNVTGVNARLTARRLTQASMRSRGSRSRRS